jgi:hypothetical protein
MMIVKKFGVLSVAITWGILSAIGGLIVGLIYALIVTVIFAIPGRMDYALSELGASGMGVVWLICIVAAPIFYGIIGFLSGLIGAAVYNVFAKRTGGIKVELLTGSDI